MSIAVSHPGSVEIRTMNGPEKVAALLLAMGKPLASRLLKHFNPAELKLITRSAAALGAVSVQSLEVLVEELAAQFSRGVDLHGTVAEVESLLGGVLPPDQVADIMADVLGNSNSSIWVRLSALPEKDLAEFVANEHPQTAALILTRLTAETAAKILAVLDRDLRNALTRRMLNLRPVSDASIRILESKLRDHLLLNADRDAADRSQARIADILNRLTPDQAEDVLTSLEQARPEQAALLRSKLFNFADIIGLSARARGIIFDKVPSDTVVLALRGSDPAVRDAALSALGARARRLVENELSSGSATAKEIDAARKSISTIILDLIGRGEIDLDAT